MRFVLLILSAIFFLLFYVDYRSYFLGSIRLITHDSTRKDVSFCREFYIYLLFPEEIYYVLLEVMIICQ